MGIDTTCTDARYGFGYGYGHGHGHGYGHGSRSYPTYPSYQQQPSRGACPNAPIDLTEDSPAKNNMKAKTAPRKRRSADDEYAEDDLVKPAKKRAKAKEEEKRLKRQRAHAPQAYADIRHRALTQRMFVIDRQRQEADESVEESRRHPIETVQLAGTTGNIYTITIDKVPTCDCPYAKKGHQCKHVVYVMARVLRAPAHLEYQLALISSELREIFEKAPPLPSEVAGDSAKDGNRKPLKDEDCPICMVEFELDQAGNPKEQVVYCKAACGNNIHKDCFSQWAATKQNGQVTCPFCRSPWQSDEESVKHVAKNGKRNSEGYVNVAGQLGLSGRRDYSTYHEYWARGRDRGRYYN